ncbi:hypothetical protein ABBQ38_005267 [Trebouxia sp. C0009 RCD-2024]
MTLLFGPPMISLMVQRFFGTAVGKGRQGAKTDIERLDLKELTCKAAVKEIAKILHTVHDEEKPFEIEMAWICDDSKKQFVKVPADLVAEADKAAKDALNSDMED